jgi:hypothetical protein
MVVCACVCMCVCARVCVRLYICVYSQDPQCEKKKNLEAEVLNSSSIKYICAKAAALRYRGAMNI